MIFKKNQTADDIQKNIEAENISSPFQPIVSDKDNELKKRSLLRDISVETLKSPIIKAEKREICHQDIEQEIDEIQVDIDLSPEYAAKREISSIEELKEIIAKNKPLKISLIINNDLSKLSQSEKSELERINSSNSNLALETIKQNQEELEKKENSQISSRLNISYIAEQKPEVKPAKPQYLSADEIIDLSRKENEEKKAKAAAFLAAKEENKSSLDMAKLYYQSDIKEYE